MNEPTAEQLADASEGVMKMAEVMTFLGVSRTRLFEIVKAGDLNQVQNGRRVLFLRAQVRNYLASRIGQNLAPPQKRTTGTATQEAQHGG